MLGFHVTVPAQYKITQEPGEVLFLHYTWKWIRMTDLVQVANENKSSFQEKRGWTAQEIGLAFADLNSQELMFYLIEGIDKPTGGKLEQTSVRDVPYANPNLFVPAEWATSTLRAIQTGATGALRLSTGERGFPVKVTREGKLFIAKFV